MWYRHLPKQTNQTVVYHLDWKLFCFVLTLLPANCNQLILRVLYSLPPLVVIVLRSDNSPELNRNVYILLIYKPSLDSQSVCDITWLIYCSRPHLPFVSFKWISPLRDWTKPNFFWLSLCANWNQWSNYHESSSKFIFLFVTDPLTVETQYSGATTTTYKERPNELVLTFPRHRKNQLTG